MAAPIGTPRGSLVGSRASAPELSREQPRRARRSGPR